MNPDVNCGLGVMMLCQWRFSDYNKCNEEGYACLGESVIWAISEHSFNFAVNLKLLLKSSLKEIEGGEGRLIDRQTERRTNMALSQKDRAG